MKLRITSEQAETRCAVQEQCQKLTDEQLANIKSFIAEVGGIENARQALLALAQCEKAA
jgi:hypothetical protein